MEKGRAHPQHSGGRRVFEHNAVADQTVVVGSCRDNTLRGWNYVSGEEEFRIERPEGASQVELAPDGRLALLGGKNGAVMVFDLEKKKLLHELEPHPSEHIVSSVAISPDGRLGITACPPGVRMWDLLTGELLHVLKPNYPMDASFSPDGRRAATAGYGPGGLVIWDVKTGQPLHRFSDTSANARFARFTPDGRGIVTADWKTGVLSLWRAPDPE